MNTADFIEAMRTEIKDQLREEILKDLQPELERMIYNNVFDFNEACRYLKVSESTLRRMVRDGEVPYFRQRGNLFFRQTALHESIIKKERSPTHD
ncbi:helix-turn-helix domain-containing protein [Paenibacillus daejeonensis]|uniref:helix-turn-helix domain-containing protein n=1 Tax=Paenibacillus daejeonensis TaxID=135193 RepID=UPI00035F92BC|nr:helix-turn-helix domain-containing protein [Paenibacillus daejeonensis]